MFQAEAERRVHQREDEEVQHPRRREAERDRRQHAEDDRRARDTADADPAQIAPRTRAPKSPCGRSTSITISTTKNVKLDQVGEISAAKSASADAHEERRDDGAAERAEAAEHDDREQPRDQVVVAARVEREDDPVHRAGGARRRDAEAEAERRDHAGVDAEQPRAAVGFCTVARTARPSFVKRRIANSRRARPRRR